MKNYRISRKLIKDMFWLAKIEYLLIISIHMFSIETLIDNITSHWKMADVLFR